MQGRGKVSILSGLGLSLVLALLISPFASSAPDGLDRFASDQRIEESRPAWSHAPMGDYRVEGVAHGGISTGLAGVIGTLAVFGATLAIGWALKRRGAGAEEAGQAGEA